MHDTCYMLHPTASTTQEDVFGLGAGRAQIDTRDPRGATSKAQEAPEGQSSTRRPIPRYLRRGLRREFLGAASKALERHECFIGRSGHWTLRAS